MKVKHLIVLVLIFSGCQKIYFNDDPVNNPVNNFKIFWNDFDRYYAQFNLRKINWDSVYLVYQPQISTITSDKKLFEVLSGMVVLINDMHVNLFAPNLGVASWKKPYPAKYPSNRLINPYKYLIAGKIQQTPFEYRNMHNNNIGYIAVYSFTTEGKVTNGTDKRYLEIDKILEQFKYKDGIIIDVRMNGGGNSSNARIIASRFADMKRIACKSITKTGPGKNDFSDWENWYIEPDGNFRYDKPVVVLTSRSTSSSAETFIAYMNVLPQVIIIGDTTAGGCGNPIYRELPNGWTYRLSTAINATADNKVIEEKGIAPDIPVQTSVTDSINGIDRILERAIEIIQTKE